MGCLCGTGSTLQGWVQQEGYSLAWSARTLRVPVPPYPLALGADVIWMADVIDRPADILYLLYCKFTLELNRSAKLYFIFCAALAVFTSKDLIDLLQL